MFMTLIDPQPTGTNNARDLWVLLFDDKGLTCNKTIQDKIAENENEMSGMASVTDPALVHVNDSCLYDSSPMPDNHFHRPSNLFSKTKRVCCCIAVYGSIFLLGNASNYIGRVR